MIATIINTRNDAKQDGVLTFSSFQIREMWEKPKTQTTTRHELSLTAKIYDNIFVSVVATNAKTGEAEGEIDGKRFFLIYANLYTQPCNGCIHAQSGHVGTHVVISRIARFWWRMRDATRREMRRRKNREGCEKGRKCLVFPVPFSLLVCRCNANRAVFWCVPVRADS